MSINKIMPRSNYLHTTDWQELYILTQHWREDLDFYHDELGFLKTLLQKYAFNMAHQSSVLELQNLTHELENVIERVERRRKEVHAHINKLGLLIEYAFNDNENDFRKEHIALHSGLTDLCNAFKALKMQIFDLSGEVLKQQKEVFLLN